MSWRRYWLLCLVLLIGIGCETKPPPNRPNFNIGDIVELRMNTDRAMVVNVWYSDFSPENGWYVSCRVGGSKQKHRDGLVSKDTEIIGYPIIRFRAYELRKVEEKEGASK